MDRKQTFQKKLFNTQDENFIGIILTLICSEKQFLINLDEMINLKCNAKVEVLINQLIKK